MGIFQVNGQIQTRGNGLGIINDASFATKLTLSEEQLWARGHYFIINDAEIGSYGLYGRGTTSYYYWVGQNMYAPWMKVEPNGTITATKFVGSLQGNADTASKWKTARTLTIGNQSNSIDGSSNISYSVDSILMTNTKIDSTTDWNTVLNAGGYRVHGGNGFTAEYNGPVGAYAYGGLYVLGKNNTDHWPIHQIYIPHTTSASGIWYRSGWTGIYNSSWNLILDSNNYTKYTVTKSGSGASGTWGISITGNAATATTLTGLTASINELNYISGATSNIQDQLTENASSISTLTATVSNKVDKVSGKGLSTNDYTTDEKNKLAGIAAGANKTTVDSALSSTSTNPVQNKVVNAAITNAAEVSVGTTQPTSSNVKVWYDTSASTVKTKVKNGSTFTELQGVSGVYVGTGTMPSGYNVQINPAGEATTEFAPAGYGLGENSKILTSADDLFAQPNGNYGWYGSPPVNAPSLAGTTSSGYCYARVDCGNDSQSKRVTVWTYIHGYEVAELVAVKQEGTWHPWEWANPPMYFGIEYRTTERWDGKVVYSKLIDLGAMPNTTKKTVSGVIPAGVKIVETHAFFHKTNSDGTFLTALIGDSADGETIWYDSGAQTVTIKTQMNASDRNASVLIKYIKN